jgi:hypothetical protein
MSSVPFDKHTSDFGDQLMISNYILCSTLILTSIGHSYQQNFNTLCGSMAL